MLLKKVSLINIRSYTSHTVNFEAGTTLLAGDIGAGKSSVLLAIEFALFGIIRGTLDGQSLLRHGQNTGSVELSCTIDNKDVTIYRSLKRSKEDVRQDFGHIEINEQRIIGTPIELKSKILELLGYPKDALTKNKSLIYRYTVYTPQEEMRAILSEDKEARQETIRKVFGVDRYKRAAENASTILRALRENKNLSKVRAEGLDKDTQREKTLIEEINQAEIQLKESESAAENIRKELLNSEAKRIQLEKEREKFNETATKIRTISAQISEKENQTIKFQKDEQRINTTYADIKEQITKLSIPETKLPLAELKKTFEELRENHQKLSSIKASKTQELLMLKTQKGPLETEVKIKENRVITLSAKRELFEDMSSKVKTLPELTLAIEKLITQSITAERAAAEHELMHQQAEKLIAELESVQTCPLCRQEIEHNHKKNILEDANSKREKAKKEIETHNHNSRHTQTKLTQTKIEKEHISKLHSSLHALEKELENLSEMSIEVAAKKEQLGILQKKEEELQNELTQTINKQLSEYESQIARTKNLIEQIESQQADEQKIIQLKSRITELEHEKQRVNKENETNTKQIAELQNLIAELTKETKAFAGTNKDYTIIQENISKLHQQEKDALAKRAHNLAKQNSLKQEQKNLQELIAQKEKHRKDADKIGAINEWVSSALMPTLNLMEQHVLARAHAEFSEYFTKWFSSLMDDETISARIDDAFSAIIEQNGYETPIQNLSGGEKTSCALAYRLALNRVINDLIPSIKTKDLLILDEPTEGFSSEQLDRVREVLRELNLKQIIIVSHEQKIESFVDHVIHIQKSQHISKSS